MSIDSIDLMFTDVYSIYVIYVISMLIHRRAGCTSVHLAGGAALDEDEVVVSDAFVHHLFGRAHVAGIEGLLAFIRGHGEKHLPWAIHGPWAMGHGIACWWQMDRPHDGARDVRMSGMMYDDLMFEIMSIMS
jgi:hypothetical protein